MAENDGSRILRVDEFGEEDVERGADGIEGKVASIFGEGEEGKGDGEGKGGECGLRGRRRTASQAGDPEAEGERG